VGRIFVVDVKLSIVGTDPISGLEELDLWLSQEPVLRGRIKSVASAPSVGELGAVTDILVAALGAGGAVSVLASSLRGFLSQPRRSDVRITVEGPDGRRVELEAKRVDNVEGLVRLALGQEG
jgi:hypothetical protein